MSPTLPPGERCILNRWLHVFVPYHRGDIVVVRDRRDGTEVVKRVVGLPNERISFRDGLVFVNGKRLGEPYLPAGTRTYHGRLSRSSIVLGPDEFFVLGDNRRVSDDSRAYGPVHRQQLLGTVNSWL